MRQVTILLFGLMAANAWTQPRNVEVWGGAGVAGAAGDEGSIGTGVAYSAGVTVPVWRQLAVEGDVLRVHAERFPPGVTRVFLSPAVVWRFGAERMYGFAGGGVGLQIDKGRTLELDFRPGQQPPLARERPYTDAGATLHGRGGVVINPGHRVLVRAELLVMWHYVLPTVGARFSIGYRF